MAYNSFTINQVCKQFGMQVQEEPNLFPQISPVVLSETMQMLLSRYIPLAEAIGTEKAKSDHEGR